MLAMGVTVAPQKNNRWTGPTDWNSRNKPGDQRERESERERERKKAKRSQQKEESKKLAEEEGQ